MLFYNHLDNSAVYLYQVNTGGNSDLGLGLGHTGVVSHAVDTADDEVLALGTLDDDVAVGSHHAHTCLEVLETGNLNLDGSRSGDTLVVDYYYGVGVLAVGCGCVNIAALTLGLSVELDTVALDVVAVDGEVSS